MFDVKASVRLGMTTTPRRIRRAGPGWRPRGRTDGEPADRV